MERSVNIYVGNLPNTATEDSVRQIFEQYGQVAQIKIIKDNYTSEPRGFGFVEMPSKDEATAAIEGANGAELGGKKLIVNEAKPRQDHSKGRRGGGGGFEGRRSRSW